MIFFFKIINLLRRFSNNLSIQYNIDSLGTLISFITMIVKLVRYISTYLLIYVFNEVDE